MSVTAALPSRTESWKFTNLGRAVDALTCTPLCTTPGCLEAALPVVVGAQLVLHNGRLEEKFSQSFTLAKGATYRLESDTPHAALLDELDAREAPQTLVIEVNESLVLPFHLIYASSGEPSTARVRVVVAPGVNLTLIEHHVAAPKFETWGHADVELVVGEGANVTHSVLQTLPPKCLLTRRTRLTMAARSKVWATQLQAGGLLSRMEMHSTLAEDCTLTWRGLSATRHRQLHDSTLVTTLTGERNTVSIRQRNAVNDEGTAVFQGKYHVHPLAQKTDAMMHVHSLLLSPSAKANHKPELEIYADDVRCTHGSATGGLDDAQLFYMKARGLPEDQAKALLLEGFTGDFVTDFPETTRRFVRSVLALQMAESPFTPTEAPVFEPMSDDFMVERAETPIVPIDPETAYIGDEGL
jgi:Fe-S cluster assembly protein SufD